VLLALIAAGVRGLPLQGQLDQSTLDLTAYCLLRFPPSEE
jgi:hypothetical protein